MDSPREFTRQILAKIGGDALLPPYVARNIELKEPCRAEEFGECAHVLVAADHSAPSAIQVVREAVSIGRFGYRVDVLADTALADKLRRYVPARSLCITDSLPDCGAFYKARAFVVSASPSILAKVSMGFEDGLSAQAALWALWHGIAVYMDLTCAGKAPDGSPCHNDALRALCGDRKEKLLTLGVKHAARGEVLPALLALLGQDAISSVPAETASQQDKRVFITAKDVMAYGGGAEWMLPANTVLTDAAKDAAARRNIIFRNADGLSGGGKER